MKLHVRNLGRINEAELDIRPLTVFVGKNNTNKTWVAYSLYGLLRNLTWRQAGIGSVRAAGPTMMKLRPDATRSKLQAAAEREVARLPMPQASDADTVELEVSRRALLGFIDEPVRFALNEKYLGKLLRLGEELSIDARVTLELTPEELRAREALAMLQLSYSQRSLQLTWQDPDPNVRVAQRRSGDANALREQAAVWLRAFAQRFLSLGLLLLLPAERETVVAVYKNMRPSEEVALTEPPEAYAHFLFSAELKWRKREKPMMPEPLELINKRILGGTVDFVEVGAGQRMVFIPEKGPALPIHAASALVRSLAGLALYIQHGARAGDVLIIDEPEMNAHPEAQLATVELLALLVNRGVRVIMTTHSSFILDHLNNLILAGRLSPKDQEEVMPEFRLGTKESFLKPNDVAAYQFDENADESQVRVTSIFDPTNAWSEVKWDTFGDPSIYVGNLKMQTLVSKLPDPEQAA
ncbi:MAG: ATP-binding protein [Polyangiaceae bacterium]|nr:ATP-binding protein [Polyangiaceae bacterium]